MKQCVRCGQTGEDDEFSDPPFQSTGGPYPMGPLCKDKESCDNIALPGENGFIIVRDREFPGYMPLYINALSIIAVKNVGDGSNESAIILAGYEGGAIHCKESPEQVMRLLYGYFQHSRISGDAPTYFVTYPDA